MAEASEVLDLAKKQYKTAIEGWKEVYRSAKSDLDFMDDTAGAQWDGSEFNARATVGRPVPQIDQLTQFKHQVVNDIRMNTPTINVIPADLDSDPETAEMLAGRVKAIEYKSNADSAYDTATDFSVGCSIGFIRVDRKYIDDESFEQELIIRRVVNPLAIFIDPSSTEQDGSDAMYGFIIEEVPIDDFKKKWPDAEPISFSDSPELGLQSFSSETMVSIVEYFVIETDEDEYGLLPDGTKKLTKGSKEKFVTKRKVKKRVVRHYKLSGQDILEETTFPGKYIPIVPVYGEEHWNGGKRHLFSLIRKAKDAQRTYNLWKALETELLLKQQQAPVQAAVGQMRGFEDDWSDPAKAMVLYYHQTDIDGQKAPAPQRLQPPTIPTGVVNASEGTANNIRQILGMYNAAAGQREGDASGVALKQLDQSSDVGNYHFSDNLTKSVTQVGKIIVCALPEIEDTQRIVTIIDKEENTKMVGINGAMAPDQERPYHMGQGKYDVRVTVGASYTTQRQQAAELYQKTLQLLPPEAAMNVLDLVFKYQDTPGAQAMESRFKKMVDPKFLDQKDREENQPDPQVMQLQQALEQVTQQAQQQIAQLQAELQSKQAEQQVKMAEVQIKAKEAEIKQEEVAIKAGDLKLKYMTAMKPEPTEVSIPQVKEQPQTQMGASIPLDAPLEVFQAAMQHKVMKQQQDAEEQQNQQMQAMTAQQMQEQKEEQERQMELMEMQQRQEQAVAVIQALGGISQQLNNLTQTVSQPITVIRDNEGNLIGAQ